MQVAPLIIRAAINDEGGAICMRSKAMVLSSVLFSGVFVAAVGSGWSQTKSPSSSDPNSRFETPQQLPSGDPTVRQPGAGNPEPGQNPNAGKKDDALKSKTSSKSTTQDKSTVGARTGDKSNMGKDTSQSLESGNPVSREPGSSNPEPGQVPSGGQKKQ